MKKFVILLLLLFNAQWPFFNIQWSMVNSQWSMVNSQWSMSNVFANDGVYYTSGNVLVPLRETDRHLGEEGGAGDNALPGQLRHGDGGLHII